MSVGEIEYVPEVLYCSFARVGYLMTVPFWSTCTRRVEPQAHGIAAVLVDFPENLFEEIETCRTRSDIACKMYPGDITAVEKEWLAVDGDAIHGLGQCGLNYPNKYYKCQKGSLHSCLPADLIFMRHMDVRAYANFSYTGASECVTQVYSKKSVHVYSAATMSADRRPAPLAQTRIPKSSMRSHLRPPRAQKSRAALHIEYRRNRQRSF
jgi:hypothetical protein